MTVRKNRAGVWLGWAGLMAVLTGLAAADISPAARYEKIFLECRETHQKQPTNAEAAWRYARACYDRADLATNSAQRAEFAQLGIEAARTSVRLQSNQAAAHYYLGINLGMLADATRSLGGLKLVSEMEQCFKRAGELDVHFDYGGPDRCLGLLYRDAPGWPISLGSKSRARQHLERARQLAGDYPENWLNLLQTWLKWGEKGKVQAELASTEEVLKAARLKLTGEEWRLAWRDWDRTWRGIKTKAAEASRSSAQHKGTK
jgi:hypothetical protein